MLDFSIVMKSNRKVVLSFSCGKDSLAAWVVLKQLGFEVVPFYMQVVPGLEFVENSIRYYEKHFKTHIYRTISPTLYHWIKTNSSQTPERQHVIEWLNLPIFGYDDVEEGVRNSADLDETSWTAVATKWSDSVLRRIRIPQCGYTENLRKFYPVCDLNKQGVIDVIKKEGVKLPVDYEMFGRSFDGLDYQYLVEIKKRFPKDYAKILEWFPLQSAELFRAEVARKHGQDRSQKRPAKKNAGSHGGNEKSKQAKGECP